MNALRPQTAMPDAAAQPEPANGDSIIRIENFRAEYDGKLVLKDVKFQVRRGEVLVIGGGSGCGKSGCSSTSSGSIARPPAES
jgi:ABC-type transporter Mla maintaining outer membrane lipid asymmetry ATPase subunit MlaF